MFEGIDLFSDTVTRPSAPMRKAMVEAAVGDEQKGEDPTTRRLEETIAALLGHRAAMFFPSATMANEVAIQLHLKPGEELLAWEGCHLFLAEAGGPAVFAGAMARPMSSENGLFTADDVRRTFRYAHGPHYPVSRLLSLENTTNMGGGVAWPRETLDAVVTVARELDLLMHLDGSRLFNAAVAGGRPVKDLASPFDSVTICFSKGLGCPTGAVLAFNPARWADVRRLKQRMGGAMRQSGMLAAACLYALEHNVARLADDHRNAARLAEVLADLPHVRVENPKPSTNMVFFRWTHPSRPAAELATACQERKLRFSQVGPDRFRAVTHLDVTPAMIEEAGVIVRDVCRAM